MHSQVGAAAHGAGMSMHDARSPHGSPLSQYWPCGHTPDGPHPSYVQPPLPPTPLLAPEPPAPVPPLPPPITLLGHAKTHRDRNENKPSQRKFVMMASRAVGGRGLARVKEGPGLPRAPHEGYRKLTNALIVDPSQEIQTFRWAGKVCDNPARHGRTNRAGQAGPRDPRRRGRRERGGAPLPAARHAGFGRAVRP